MLFVIPVTIYNEKEFLLFLRDAIFIKIANIRRTIAVIEQITNVFFSFFYVYLLLLLIR